MNFPKSPRSVKYEERQPRVTNHDVIDLQEVVDQQHEGNVLESKRPLRIDDVKIVSSNLGKSWRILGHRLNFAVETLNEIESLHSSMSPSFFEEAGGHLLRVWSQLPSANVGRLAFVLWEMGRHDLALQLQP